MWSWTTHSLGCQVHFTFLLQTLFSCRIDVELMENRVMEQGDVKGSVLEFDKALELDPQQRPCAVKTSCNAVIEWECLKGLLQLGT